MTNQTLTRRRTLALTGSVLTVGVAGCLADDLTVPTGGTDDNGEDSSGSGGNAHDHDVEHEIGHPEEHVEVTMETDADGHHFVPHVVHIEPGGRVTWSLDSGVHDTVAYHPDNASLLPSSADQRIPNGSDPWASDVYSNSRDSFELTFQEEGIYDYTCTISGHGHRGNGHHGGHASHESSGMVGRIIVGDPPLDADVQPALQPSSQTLPAAARQELDRFNDQTRTALDEH